MIKNVVWSNAGIVGKQADEIFVFGDFKFYVLKQDKNKLSEWVACYFEHNNHLFYINNYKNIKSEIEQRAEEFKQFLTDFENVIVDSFEKTLLNAKNKIYCDISKGVAQYLGREKEFIEVEGEYVEWWDNKQRLENAEKERIKAEKKQKEQEAYEQDLIWAEETFKKNEPISGRLFVGLCDKYTIELPLRTLGWCLKNLTEISQGECRYKSGKGSNVVFDYVKELNKILG